MNRKLQIVFLVGLSLLLAALSARAAVPGLQVTRVNGPDLARTNRWYVGNRAPLMPAAFIPLPLGSVTPDGWVREFLERQRRGLTGHLGEISAWLQKDDNAWLSKNGKGKYGWEELPYWLKGYIELAYIFNDPAMIRESKVWIEGVLASQRPDGDFGPDERFKDDGTRDYWANMIMLFCLESYYDQTSDPRVLTLMSKYFKYQLGLPDKAFLTHYWQRMRGGDNLYAVYWLYNRTGDPELLRLGEKIHRRTANWEMKGDLPNWHNVNIAEGFREPGQFYLQSHNSNDMTAAYANFFEVRKRYGQVPGGMFGGDENCRPGYTDPHQAVETCGMVEQMLSDEILFQISGDPFWADQCETVAFNTYPAAVLPDFRALRYLTAPNMAVSDSKNHAPGLDNNGPFLMMNPFSSRCCQHNHSHGWPYFNKSLWMATPDDGLCATLYSASQVEAKAGDGKKIRITEETHYPFEETIRFKIRSSGKVRLPLYLRIPSWCAAPVLAVNGRAVGATGEAGRFFKIDRTWASGDKVELKLPMKVSIDRWPANHDAASVNYGPLTFSLKIGERYDRRDSKRTAVGDSNWQPGADPSKWPAFEIQPTTPWNYGLELPAGNVERAFEVEHRRWPKNNFPFTPEDAPLVIKATGHRIPEWTLDRYGLCAELQPSPVRTETPAERVSLIPMGAARLRIASFPVVARGNGGHQWTAPPMPRPAAYKATASHCFSGDSLEALSDSLEPKNSDDHTIPRFTWWDHRGTREWVQYNFATARRVASIDVYWFDDTGEGQCRLPRSWRLLYQQNGEWKPISNRVTPIAANQWNHVDFDPVTTPALRISAELQPGFSAGILEWKIAP